MAKKSQAVSVDFLFFHALLKFYHENRGMIRSHYKDLTKKILDYNDPSRDTAFLRKPQFEAFEMYVFLKEFLGNAKVHDIFEEWFDRRERFASRSTYHDEATLFGELNKEQYKAVFERMKKFELNYANYIFALTMGVGKTILMATCIFYEFILSNKHPKDERFCHNALVFAPDKTVLQALREIVDLDKSKVIPPEYANWLDTELKFHFLEESGATLNTIDRSRFNIIISNAQKIILKNLKEKDKADLLFESKPVAPKEGSVYEQYADIYAIDDEDNLLRNQRFWKLTRLENIAVYVDEAHHVFGADLLNDMDSDKKTSLRTTINELAQRLQNAGNHLVACHNFTGTPYVGKEILPEVVYAYGLKDAIESKYLKLVNVKSIENVRSEEHLREVVERFWKLYGENRYEGLLPKIAIYGTTVDELVKEIKPALEKLLEKNGIPLDRILVNVEDDKITKQSDRLDFNRLDTPESTKQFILLVNKGKEGWNCRSLFAVSLYREPKSKIFVLQSTMRCLRAITPIQQTATVFLSAANFQILENELTENFRMTIEDLSPKTEKRTVTVRLVPPPVTIQLTKFRFRYEITEKEPAKGFGLGLDGIDWDRYKATVIHNDQFLDKKKRSQVAEDITAKNEQVRYSFLTLVAEISNYLKKSPLLVEEILERSGEGVEKILETVNRENKTLYDYVIPALFQSLYLVTEFKNEVPIEVELVKTPKDGSFQVQVKPDLLADMESPNFADFKSKSFHLDNYCFDSLPEFKEFQNLLKDDRLDKVYFTGMFRHGQTDFHIHYVDPETHALRAYYPDFAIKKKDGAWVILEVKGDNMIDDSVVLAKQEAARKMAVASGMTYEMVKGSDADAGLPLDLK
jgi:hypothetical protein